MSDFFYHVVRVFGSHAFWVSATPTILGRAHTHRTGAYILAANHESPYDIALLIRHCARAIDFISIIEVFRNPLVAWFYNSMNAVPLDRSRADVATVRKVLDRLSRGRVVGMFPEGRFRRGEDSVIRTRRLKPGIGRIAQMAGAPIVPCVIVNSSAYARFASWLPLRRTRYGLNFGEPIMPQDRPEETERQLVEAFVRLHAELLERMEWPPHYHTGSTSAAPRTSGPR